MSLIINGMDMPKHNAMHGGKDTIYRAVIRVKPDGTATITINFQTGYTYEDGDLKTAPISEIPTPHGDLIDRDDLLYEINRSTFVERYDYNTAYDAAALAETVIEAEGSYAEG